MYRGREWGGTDLSFRYCSEAMDRHGDVMVGQKEVCGFRAVVEDQLCKFCIAKLVRYDLSISRLSMGFYILGNWSTGGAVNCPLGESAPSFSQGEITCKAAGASAVSPSCDPPSNTNSTIVTHIF